MKRLAFILCIITFLLNLSACKVVNLNSADELVNGSWQVTNTNGVSAELSFDVPQNEADFTISDENGEKSTIQGVFAVDSENLFITSTELCKTYKFGYEVYKDRVILSYNGIDLTLNSSKEKEPQ